MVMTKSSETLEEAQRLAITGDYLGAIALINSVLKREPNNVEALRFKGNVIELKVFHSELNENNKFVRSPEILKARVCYEKALLLEPNNPGVLADLGTHWNNLGNTDKAICFFDRVIALLPDLPELSSSGDDFMEALEGKIEILLARGEEVDEVTRLQQQLNAIICAD
jgi:tetratricopeptide (TPR) repeat protein